MRELKHVSEGSDPFLLSCPNNEEAGNSVCCAQKRVVVLAVLKDPTSGLFHLFDLEKIGGKKEKEG